MPENFHFFTAARQKALELGFHAVILSEAVKAPAVLISTGEVVVTVDKYQGIGGRNQEYVLAAASKIAGSKGIVITSVDTDGTDGPGGIDIYCKNNIEGAGHQRELVPNLSQLMNSAS